MYIEYMYVGDIEVAPTESCTRSFVVQSQKKTPASLPLRAFSDDEPVGELALFRIFNRRTNRCVCHLCFFVCARKFKKYLISFLRTHRTVAT